jgi:hypothetical protein
MLSDDGTDHLFRLSIIAAVAAKTGANIPRVAR